MTARTRLWLHALAALLLILPLWIEAWDLGPVGVDLLLVQTPAAALQSLSSIGRWQLEWTLRLQGPLPYAEGPAWRALRLENLLWWVGACWCFAAALRRALEPWIGPDSARATLRTALLLLPLGGFGLVSTTQVLARGEFMALFFASLALLSYLRWRQSQRALALGLALAATAIAGACGRASFALPLVIAALEWLSARRHRPWRAVLLASLGAFSVFGLVRMGCAYAAGERWTLEYLGVELWARSLSTLGRSLAPLAPGRDLVRTLLAGVWVLIALQPLLTAVRTAPRTYGRFALAWSLALLGVVSGAALCPPAQLPPAWWLEVLPAALLLGCAWATAVSARGGWRRAVLPWVLALLGVWICLPLLREAREAREQFTAVCARLASEHAQQNSPDVVYTGLPATTFANQRVTLAEQERLLSAASGLQANLRLARASALLPWAAHPSFPRDVLWLEHQGPSTRLLSAVPGSALERVFWREYARSPQVLDVRPREQSVVRIVARAGTPTESAPRLYWRVEGRDQPYSALGVWLDRGNPGVAWFELSREAGWMLAERVRRIWSEGDLLQVTSAEVLAGPLSLAPTAGLQWEAGVARLPEFSKPELDLEGRRIEWVLCAFDPTTLENHEWPALPQGSGLIFQGAQPGLDYHLELRLEGVVVARGKL